MKIGDKVIVNNKWLFYVDKYGWNGIENLVGQILTIENIGKYSSYEDDYYRAWFKETEWWVPLDCLDYFNDNETLSIKWYKKGKLEK